MDLRSNFIQYTTVYVNVRVHYNTTAKFNIVTDRLIIFGGSGVSRPNKIG